MKKISLVVLALLLFNYSHAEMLATHCFNQPLEFKCVDQENGHFSLEGKYQYKGKILQYLQEELGIKNGVTPHYRRLNRS